MKEGPTILIDWDYPVGKEQARSLIQLCLPLAKRAWVVTGGQVSVRFSKGLDVEYECKAEFMWQGKGLVKIFPCSLVSCSLFRVETWSSQRATREWESAWEKVFVPALIEGIEVLEDDMKAIKERVRRSASG